MLTAESARELDVALKDEEALRVDGHKNGLLQERDEVRLDILGGTIGVRNGGS
jgi:hypothetical protein